MAQLVSHNARELHPLVLNLFLSIFGFLSCWLQTSRRSGVGLVIAGLWIVPGISASPSPLLSNVTIYATNPRISYHPESACKGTIFGGCGVRYDPWDVETYKSPYGVMETYYRTSSWQNHPGSTEARQLVFAFKGHALFVYGAPRKQIEQFPSAGSHEICLDDDCHIVDVAVIYALEPPSSNEPVLIWMKVGLRFGHDYQVQIRLLETSERPVFGMTFHHFVYTDVIEDRIPIYRQGENQTLINVTYHDTNPRISYLPTPESYDPWDKEYYLFGTYHQTFHRTSNWGNHPEGNLIRRVEWTLEGTAVYIFGAPRIQLKHPPGHTDICIDTKCHAIDAARIYLNSPFNHDPVLLWYDTNLNPAKTTTVQIRFLQKESLFGRLFGMAFSRAVFTRVKQIYPSIDGVRYLSHTVDDGDQGVHYLPYTTCRELQCRTPFNPWDVETYSTSSGRKETFHRTSTWLNALQGENNRRIDYRFPCFVSKISVFGAPPAQLRHPHGKQEICIWPSVGCTPVDAEQAYLNIPTSHETPVLIWSIDGLDESRLHSIEFRLIDRTEEGDGAIRGLTFSHMDYVEARPPPRPPSPPVPFPFSIWTLLALLYALICVILIGIRWINYLSRDNHRDEERRPLLR
ncbi:hypothetical protein FRC02_002559 [Tulasnella sp. 418]|nr:hypothetical protein FRC02_002559 [Tulasnella sp. 418]